MFAKVFYPSISINLSGAPTPITNQEVKFVIISHISVMHRIPHQQAHVKTDLIKQDPYIHYDLDISLTNSAIGTATSPNAITNAKK